MPNEEQTYRQMLMSTLDRIETDMKEGFDGVHTRQDKTNGRVGKLENWRWFFSGGMAVIAMLVIPLLIYIWEKGV